MTASMRSLLSTSATPSATSGGDAGQRLRRVVALRWVALITELALIFLTRRWLGAASDIEPVLAICALQAGFNLATIAATRQDPLINDWRLFLQLLFDIGVLTAIAYLAGGSTNPLITLYLLWIAVGAVMLGARLAALTTALCIAGYSWVNFVHAEVHIHDHEKALQVHLVGMWLVFVFSAIAISWSVVRLTAAVRERDARLAQAREAALRSERVVALGNLAAGAAHELGTPLATMAMLTGEMLSGEGLSGALRADLELLLAQVRECKRIITGLAAQAGTSRAEALTAQSLRTWIEELVQRWRLQRPQVEPAVSLDGDEPPPIVIVDATIGQALINLFNNAADASPRDVQIDARWQGATLAVHVLDRGPGLPREVLANLGQPAVSSRADGLGVGLVLAVAAIERSGGMLAFDARPGGGTCARVQLPLALKSAP